MNIYKKLILLAMAASCLACNKEIEVPTQNSSVRTMTIEAYNAENETKNLVDEFGSVLWNPNDSISVFFGDYCVPFYSYNSKPVARANFIGTALVTIGENAEYDGSSEEYEYWGVYPYQTHNFKYVPSKYEGGVACFVDEFQAAVDNTFDRSTFVTVARSTNYSKLAFYNLCGGVRFKLASSDIEMVTFSGNSNEPLAGEVVVDMDAEGHPYVKKQYSEIKTIRLTAPEGSTFKAGVWYYIVSLPADLSSGFTMKFISKSENKMATLQTSSPVKVERSHFGSLDCPDAGLDYTQYDGSEENAQLKNEVYVKSVTMGADESFSVELGYPTIATQKIFEKIKFKIYGELVSPYYYTNDNIGKLSETLYCVGVRYNYDEHSVYVLSPEEQYQIQYIMNYTFPDYVFYSSKSKKFISIDTSDEALHTMAHRNYNHYLGGCGNNNFFFSKPNSYYDKTPWQKLFNIIETEDDILLQEWGDIDTDRLDYDYFWLAENKFPAILYEAESGNVIMETFPEKGVMHKLVLSDQPDYWDYWGDAGLIKAGNTTYWKYEKYGHEYGMTCFRQLATENGAPVEGNLIIAPYNDLVYYNLSEPKMSIINNYYYCDYRFGGYYDRYVYLKLSEDGSFTSYTIPQDYYEDNDMYCPLRAFVHSGYMARLYLTGEENKLTLKDFDYVTDKMTMADITIPEHIGGINVRSGVYEGNLVFAIYMIQASDATNISFVIDSRSKETFIKKGDIQLEENMY